MSPDASAATFIETAGAILQADLVLPDGCRTLVIFAHGSGSSRRSSRNVFVAERLQLRGIGTLLFDLLTPEEDQDPAKRFDIGFLSLRLDAAIEWTQRREATARLRLGLFGASTGAAAAVRAAAHKPEVVRAIVSRGGRPDLSPGELGKLKCPTLLIVGGSDKAVLELNQTSLEAIPASTLKELKVLAGATHLFEEPGKLEEVAELAADWFERHLGPGSA